VFVHELNITGALQCVCVVIHRWCVDTGCI